jgi:glutathione synthase
MRWFVVVNRVAEIGYRQTTALLIATLCNQGHEVHLVNVDGFSFEGLADRNRFSLTGFPVDSDSKNGQSDSQQIEQIANSQRETRRFDLGQDDSVLIRTNPGRDIARGSLHDSFLEFCAAIESVGVRVVNRPDKLKLFASKASLELLPPRFRPQMLVTHSASEIASFVRESGATCVIKPLVGSRGQDVIKVEAEQQGLEKLISNTYEGRGIVAQHFVHHDEPGDKRVVVVNGQILEGNGHVAGIHRIPAKGDFRANLHTGGIAQALKLLPQQREAAEHSASLLLEHGIYLAGIDLIGSKVIEFNVFSTGGIYDACRFADFDFSEKIIGELTEIQK